MNELLIHVGFHKTGTTWLQDELFNDSSEIFANLTMNGKRKSPVSLKFITDNEGYILSPFDDNEKEIKKTFLNTLKQKKSLENKILVISNERISGCFTSGGFDARTIAHRMHNVFPNAKIFICIREQKEFILSSYFQYIDKGGILRLKKYLGAYPKKQSRVPNFTPSHFRFSLLIREYQHLFGHENVLVLPYEMFKLDPKQYIKLLGDFVDKCIVVDEKRFKVKHNSKNHLFTLYYFKWLNLFKYSNSNNYYSNLNNRYTTLIANMLYCFFNILIPKSWDVKTKAKLQKVVNEWVGNRYIASNQELSEIINIDLAKYGYY